MPHCSDKKDKVTIFFWSLKSNVLEDKQKSNENSWRNAVQHTTTTDIIYILIAATFSKGIEVDDIDFANIFCVTENLIITISACNKYTK